ncbi:hypothetical protein B0E38_02518 [Streptomyces sp. 111WW2]|uniref:hypothetical protein n=1 Tax=Streptomyces sp. 111WW2 TaxID=1945515 RepID=UPI000D0C7AED|nr:hypothetical protein [Streptomyces sp. 111WW2]PSK56987.1 hypothetical protein B0E38_02518 [Streptomyces sp. 111WW2]
MALDENPNRPGSYWHELAADEKAGRFWKCRCGERNPGTYDTCHFCQRPNPTEPPAEDTGRVFTPGPDDMEDCYDGVLVASLGEDGDAIALTGDKRQALEALDQYYRRVCGQPNLLDDAAADLRDAYYWLDAGHALFTRRADGGWTVTAAAEDTPGAVPVVWFSHPSPGPVPVPYAQSSGPKIW